MDIGLEALAQLHEERELLREAAVATDVRVREAHLHFDKVADGYQAVLRHVEDPAMRYMLYATMGRHLEEARLSLQAEAP